jgi:hypothetical protein
MTHDEYVAYIRERYADLFDPDNTDLDWQFLITIGPGWRLLFIEFCEQLHEGLRRHGETGMWFVRQAKEKFGELRIYVRPSTNQRPDNDGLGWVEDIEPPEPSAAQKMISIVREQTVGQANHTCEVCGEPGGLRVLDGWYKTCCDQHFLEWQERRGSK